MLAWFGTTRLFEPLSLIFRENEHGLVIAHTYQYSATHSTFLVEVDPVTFHDSGLDRMSETQALRYCEGVFAEDLQGHELLSNKSSWFRYTIVKNRQWYHDNLVLLGDALRTGHPSVGSGTRLALQDSIALFEAYKAHGTDVPELLAQFVTSRRPGSDSLQNAAIKSTEWTKISATSCRSIRFPSPTTICAGPAAWSMPTCANEIPSLPPPMSVCTPS